MIFDPCVFCAVAQTWDTNFSQPIQLGGEGVWVGLISSGRCAIELESGASMAGAGSLLIACGNTTLVPIEPVHLVAVRIHGQAALACAQGLQNPFFIGCNTLPSVADLVTMLCSDLVPLAPARTSSAAFRILCSISQADAPAPALPPLVAAAIPAIRQNYAGLYGVEELSESLGVSKCHLVRVFSAAMGMPPGQYLTEVRIEAAKQLLLHRQYSLEVIASLCGFSGSNYLCRVFRKHTGQTPAQWRTANANLSLPDTLLSADASLYI